MIIRTTKKDIVWNYVGTIVSLSSGFILLPLLLAYLSGDELGLWYVFLAISNLTQLFQWGFEPTFARNIVYVLSGAQSLTKEGCDPDSMGSSVDWHLLHVVFRASKVIFGIIAVTSTALAATIGTLYIAAISDGIKGYSHWVAWFIFLLAIFLNLYFLYTVTFLRGTGDIAGENRATTIAKLAQLAVSAVLLVFGWGLIGAAIGFLANGVLTRVLALHYLKEHEGVIEAFESRTKVSRAEIKEVFDAISFVALRNCATQFASYTSTQASTILCSLFLSLSDTGLFSVSMQLGNAVSNFAATFFRSYMPALQAAYSSSNIERQRTIVAKGVVVFWLLIVLGTVAVPVAIFPLVHILRPEKALDTWLFIGINVYLALYTHINLMTNIILSANFIPFTKAFVVSSISGIILSAVLMATTPLGAWGLVLGLLISQVYNFFKWPHWVMDLLDTKYVACLKRGFHWLSSTVSKQFGGL